MNDESSRSKKTNQYIFLTMGMVWLGLALFGLIFDPSKRLIILSQIVVGCISLIFYFTWKYKSLKNRE
jgi:hypothetical protein